MPSNDNLGGGTDFEPTHGKAVEIIEKSEFKEAFIVFITDGQDSVSTEFLKTFIEVKKRKEFSIQGFEILGASDELKKFYDQTTRLHKLGITEAGDIFEGI